MYMKSQLRSHRQKKKKTVSIRGTITGSLYSNQVRNLQILTTTVADQSGRLPVAWFNAPYLKGTLKKGSVFICEKIIRKKRTTADGTSGDIYSRSL